MTPSSKRGTHIRAMFPFRLRSPDVHGLEISIECSLPPDDAQENNKAGFEQTPSDR